MISVVKYPLINEEKERERERWGDREGGRRGSKREIEFINGLCVHSIQKSLSTRDNLEQVGKDASVNSDIQIPKTKG